MVSFACIGDNSSETVLHTLKFQYIGLRLRCLIENRVAVVQPNDVSLTSDVVNSMIRFIATA